MRDPFGEGGPIIAAVRAVAKAEILPRFRNLSALDIDTKSGPDDLVTIADHRAEAALAAQLTQLFPQAIVIGEESVAADPSQLDHIADAPLAFVLDPIDGTRNFVAGLSCFGVILSAMRYGAPQFGLLYDPVLDDWVAAASGQGAWYGRPNSAPEALRLGQGHAPDAATMYLPMEHASPAGRLSLMREFGGVRKIASMGCSCQEYRAIARGNAHGVFAIDPTPWDHAAGAFIIAEAGGAAAIVGQGAYRPAARHGRYLAAESPALLQALQA